MQFDKTKICAIAKQVIASESAAVAVLAERVGDNFVAAVNYLLNCRGRVVVIGMGKSGHIGNKIAATLASTGTPAFFVHPGEANHGDIGMVVKDDVLLAISKSGNTPEIVALLPVIKHLNVPLITLCGNTHSILAEAAQVNLDVSVAQEACSLGIVPTCSTTVTLAMGDALAVALLELRGFDERDFARSHPGGILGRRLLLTVDCLMHVGEAVPRVLPEATLREALVEITRKRFGMTLVVDAEDKLLGIFTDGDLRRTLEKGKDLAAKMHDIMTTTSKTIKPGMLAADALTLMEQYKITSLAVVDERQRTIGILHLHDLLGAGIKQ